MVVIIKALGKQTMLAIRNLNLNFLVIQNGIVILNRKWAENYFRRTLDLMKGSIFWDITPCIPGESKPTFRRNISPPTSGSKRNPSKESTRRRPPNCQLTANGLHGDISQKIELFTTTAEKTLNSTLGRVRFEVFTAVIMKIAVFWDVAI
jgi:hypothetical protein